MMRKEDEDAGAINGLGLKKKFEDPKETIRMQEVSSVKNLVVDFERKITENLSKKKNLPAVNTTKNPRMLLRKENWNKVKSPINKKKLDSPFRNTFTDKKRLKVKLDLPNLKTDLKSAKNLKSEGLKTSSKMFHNQRTIMQIWGPEMHKEKPENGPYIHEP